MKNPKLSVDRVVRIWKNYQTKLISPRAIAIEVSRKIGFNPIPITLFAQEAEDEYVRSQAIQAYYSLMEDHMLQKSIEPSMLS